jgi:inner membrane protein
VVELEGADAPGCLTGRLMASALSHATVALAIGACFTRAAVPRRALVLGVVLAVVPDLDAIGYWLGVPTGAWLGHRGFTHSIPFAFALGIAVALVSARAAAATGHRGVLALYFVLVLLSHGFLDAFTNGGPGIAFFSPLSNARYFFAWRPIQVSPIGIGVFNARGLAILATEARWVLIPAGLLAVIGIVTRRAVTVRRFADRPLR